MSAAQIGARLLAEVENVRLDEALKSIRQTLKPSSGIYLGLPEIDRLLRIVLQPADEQDVPLSEGNFASSQEADHDNIQQQYAARFRQIQASPAPKAALIELASDMGESERTDFCYLAAAVSIVGSQQDSRNSTVVWLDTDMQFDPARIHQICLKLLNKMNPQSTSHQRESEARQALRHIHVFSIRSSKSMYSTLCRLPDYLLGQKADGDIELAMPTHHSQHRRLSLIVIDSATAFYWTDRFDAEIARLELAGTTQPNRSIETPTSQIINQLKLLQSKFECMLLYTTTTTTTTTATGSHVASTNQQATTRPNASELSISYGPSQWTMLSTLSLTLSRVPVPQFSQHMTMEECQQDREKRAEVVRKNRVRVKVNETWLDKVVRNQDLKMALNRLEGQGTFVISCGEDGVEVEP